MRVSSVITSNNIITKNSVNGKPNNDCERTFNIYSSDYGMTQALRSIVTFRSREYINKDNKIETNTEKVFRQILSARNELGDSYISEEELIKTFENPEFGMNEEIAKRILDRDLIKSHMQYGLDSVMLYARINDKQYDEAKGTKNMLYFVKNAIPEEYEEYADGKISTGKLFDDYSRTVFNKIFKSFPNELAQNIYKKLTSGTVEASNIDMMLQLIIFAGVLPPMVLYDIGENNRMTPVAQDELEKLFCCFTDEEFLKSKFVPEYYSEQEALKELKTGDVCSIKNQKYIRIKKDEDNLEEIFLTPKKYFEYFPPLERFAYTQGQIGDCYILAVLDDINSNPEYRYKILELFRENDDSSVSMSFDGFKREGNKITPKNPNNYLEENIESCITEDSEGSFTCKGIKCIETLYENYEENNAQKNIDYIKQKYTDALKQMGTNDYIFMDDFIYTRDEIELTLDYIKESEKHPSDFTKKMFSLDSDLYALLIALNNEAYNNKDDKKITKLINLVEIRYKEYLIRHKMDETAISGILPYAFINSFYDIDRNHPYTYAGACLNVFNKMGFEGEYLKINNPKVKKLISDGKNLFTLSKSNDKPDKYNIKKEHAYSMVPIEINGEKKYSVKSPHNTSVEMIMSFDEISKIFDNITVAYEKLAKI